MMEQKKASEPKPSDRWIPWYFFGFFLILIAVLVPMCVVAFRTDSGIVTDNAYEKGLAYNKDIAAARALKDMGWQSDVSLTPTQRPDEVRVDFVLTNAAKQPIERATVKLWLVRPAQKGLDQKLDLKSGSEKGHYVADVKLPAHGLWEARISVSARDQIYQMTKRVTVP